MSWWQERGSPPIIPDTYRVRLPYAPYIAWARWDGERWCAWGTDRARAEMATFSGPRDGYDWRLR